MTDDEVTDLVLEGSTYDLVRRRRGVTTSVPIPRKVRWCGGVLAVAATILPIVVLLPDPVRTGYVPGDPANAPLSLVFVHLLGVGCLTVAGVGLAAIVWHRARLEAITEDQAWTLVGIESMFTGIGGVTGTTAVAASLLLAATGHGGAGTVESLLALGIDPYYAGGRPAVTARIATGIDITCAAGVFALGIAVERLE